MKRKGKKSPNGAGRLGRNKKEKTLTSDEYKLKIQSLLEKGINETDIQKIYDRCQEKNKQ